MMTKLDAKSNGRMGNRLGAAVVAVAMAGSAAAVVASRGCQAPTALTQAAPLVEEVCPPAGDKNVDQREAYPYKLDPKTGKRLKDSAGKDIPNKCYHPDDFKDRNGVCDEGESKDSLDCKLDAEAKDPCIPGDKGVEALKTNKLKRPLFSATAFYIDQLKRGEDVTEIVRSEDELRDVLTKAGDGASVSTYFLKQVKLEESCKLTDPKDKTGKTDTIDCAPGVDKLCYCVNACGARPKKLEPKTVKTELGLPVEEKPEVPSGGPCQSNPDWMASLAPARKEITQILSTMKSQLFEDHGTPTGGKVVVDGSISFVGGRVSSATLKTKCVRTEDAACTKAVIAKNPIASNFTTIKPVDGGPTCNYSISKYFDNL
jgi:hypothetical protein